MFAISTRLLITYALIAVAVLACWPSAVALDGLWTDTQGLGYTHGYLLAAVSAWLIFRSRARLAAAPVKPSPPAHVALLVCGFLWFVFWRAGIRELHLVLLPPILWLAVYAAFGRNIARVVLFPLGFLYFTMPVWDVFTPVLQSLTVHVNTFLLGLFRVRMYVEGNLVFLPSGTFEIASGCSGLHFWMVGLALAALLGELNGESLRNRIRLLAIMGALAIVTNWIRVFVIIEAGYLTKMRHYLVTVDHYRFGWALFALAVILFLWIVRRLPASKATDATDPSQSGVVASTAILPLACITAALALAAVPAAIYAANSHDPGQGSATRLALPQGLSEWRGPKAAPGSGWQPQFLSADASVLGAYTNTQGRTVEAFLVVYRVQRQGRELIGSSNSLLGNAGLVSQREGIVSSAIGQFRETLVTDPNGTQSLVWSRYDVGGRLFVMPLLAQVWYGVSSVTGEQDSGLVAFRASCEGTCEDARAVLERFARSMEPQLQAAVRMRNPEPVT